MKKKKTVRKADEIKIKGDLIVGNVQMMKKVIEKEIMNFSAISFEEVTQIDLSGIQLLESVKKAFAQSGKNLKINIEIPSECLELLTKCGFRNLPGMVNLNA
jgi:ABC-type transporter Mla MlaB component